MTSPRRGDNHSGSPSEARSDRLSLIVPLFNESAVIRAFWARASAALEAIPAIEFEMLFVDDGSQDDTWQQALSIAAEDPRVRLIRLSRNFGHQVAITAGLDHATGDCLVVIDADLQDPPEVIADMVERWREGHDVVYGVRRTRAGESVVKLATANAFYRVLNAMTKIQIPVNVGDFRLISRRVANQLGQMREKERFVRGLVSWIGFRQVGVMYDRDERYAGSTKYPYARMLRFAMDGVTSFSMAPLRLATWMGYAASILAFVYLVSVFVQKLLGYTVQGWPTIMVAVLFLGGVQLICLGILGEYLGRVFNEIKPRPMYIIDQAIGPDANGFTGVTSTGTRASRGGLVNTVDGE